MALLFDRDRSVISRHIKNIYDECELEKSTSVHFLHISNIYNEGELDKKSTCAKNAHMVSNRDRLYETELYNLDIIISVGYRVKSKNGTLFRIWANKILKEYLLKGYIINENRTLVTNENYINLINRVDSIDSRLKQIENNELSNKKEKLIVNSDIFDSISYLENMVSKANPTKEELFRLSYFLH